MTDHRREARPREYLEYFCAEPSCEFFGKPTQQGICHTRETDVADIDKLYKVAEDFANELADFYRPRYGADKDEYIAHLESLYECAMLNWTFGLDEMIRLRKENALLKLRIEKLEKKDAPPEDA